MIKKQTIAGFCLSLVVFGFISKIFITEQEKIYDEQIKVRIFYPNSLNPITASGTASTVSGPVTFY